MFLATLIGGVSFLWCLPFEETKSESYPQETWQQVKNEGTKDERTEEDPEI